MWLALFIFCAGAVLFVGGYFILRYVKEKSLHTLLNMELLLIQIPRERKREGERGDFKLEINQSEQLFSNLLILRAPFVLEVAVPHLGEEIHFHLAVPRTMREAAIKQVQGIWHNASVSKVPDDYSVFNGQGESLGAFLKQKEDFALPFRTYAEVGADTFSSVLSGFSKIKEIGEGAVFQVVVKPASSEAKRKIQSYLRALKKGETLESIFRHKFPWGMKEISHALSPGKEDEEKKERIVDEEAFKILEAKLGKPLFEVNGRFIASAPTHREAGEILDGLMAGLHQLAAPRRNEIQVVQPRDSKKLIYNYIYRSFDPSRAMILNSEELASLFHFPISSSETPRIKWLKAKESAPPNNLPDVGLLLGRSVFRGNERPVYMTDEDRRRHIYAIGQTGTGKSTFLGNLIIQDIKEGKGVALIDPHGELVEGVLGHIPPERLDDLVLFDPGDPTRPLGLNMIDFNPNRPEEKTFIVNEMQSIFNKLFPPETMGPMFEQYMRNALLLLMEDAVNEPATLVEVPRVFTDAAYRKRKIDRIKNPVVVDFWEKEAAKAGGDASLANMTPYITSKFNNFIANDYMRPIIGQEKSALNFREAMDQGKILLVNLSKGRIGDINAGLLGMIITGKLLMAALSRADEADASKRRDFYLYIDEFQNFTTDSIATILSEARKYRLNLIMAHQFIAQLTDKIKDAVFGNVGSQVIFRVGIQDAEFLVKQFEPIFNQNDLVNIDNLNAYVKLLINGQTSQAFNMKMETTFWGGGTREMIEKMKEYSRMKHGQDRQKVEQGIFERLRF